MVDVVADDVDVVVFCFVFFAPYSDARPKGSIREANDTSSTNSTMQKRQRSSKH